MLKTVIAVLLIVMGGSVVHVQGAEGSDVRFGRAPLRPAPYAELPVTAVKPRGWLLHQLQTMAKGTTGRLDELYPEICGPDNAWLGGSGDAWERGPYWIDGLLPLAHQLEDKALIAKVQPWIDWTLENQREDGYIGPRHEGDKLGLRGDWWPRMVMLKVLQQHYMATGDERIIPALLKYFRFQLETLPEQPLVSTTWWARQRGGDNLMIVLWTYNLTGEKWLLDLADLLYEQTLPFTDIFMNTNMIAWQKDSPGITRQNWKDRVFHCVNLVQGLKTPIIRYQQDGDTRHLQAVERALEDILLHHGQPHGLFGGDEAMHGRELHRGSELCTAVEMMFSLENMLAITGNVDFADRLEHVAFNVLPTQASDDYLTRQYFQQANQVLITDAERSFFDDGGERQIYGLLNGFPCCTCNMHQGWPKYVQHLWMASRDGGLAALAYGPCELKTTLPGGQHVAIRETTDYPFRDTITFDVVLDGEAKFPLHLRIPSWCKEATLTLNGKELRRENGGQVVVLDRTWTDGDKLELTLPMTLRRSYWYEHAVAVERGPLLYALRIEEHWSDYPRDDPRVIRECRPGSPWNYALLESKLGNLAEGFKVVEHEGELAKNPWTLENAPLELRTQAVRLPDWGLANNSAADPLRSPVHVEDISATEPIRLIPYGCTTLRISAFPWVIDKARPAAK